MELQESGQMYLETILVLSRRCANVRAIDIVEHMGYSKPSVSRAMGLLKSGGYIEVSDAGHITLTAVGREIAEKIYDRHTVLTSLLTALGVSEQTAAADACRMEHILSDESYTAIKKYISKR